ncbi:hypothetical protein CSUB01_11211 [Colletotrichum sublineola]|uniref:Uncharacterized protein n=1 Tax=Colletotrichum sublineola TaxID=1173701 RepID=A0A066XHA4_COLSU|nr:hypothetical protein CSUB01_11211 [Colletotrichum sublineola]
MYGYRAPRHSILSPGIGIAAALDFWANGSRGKSHDHERSGFMRDSLVDRSGLGFMCLSMIPAWLRQWAEDLSSWGLMRQIPRVRDVRQPAISGEHVRERDFDWLPAWVDTPSIPQWFVRSFVQSVLAASFSTGCPIPLPTQTVNVLTNFRVWQTVCGVSIDYYRQAGPQSGVSWCVHVRAEILRAIVANHCLPPHVNHPNFQGRFMPSVRIACNMVHGDDFASVIGPQFDRLVKHYAKRWVVANGIVLEDKSVADGFRFNQELVARSFNDVASIERWLRDDMGKLDWWEKVARDPGLVPPPTPYPSTAVATPKRATSATPATPATSMTPTTPTRSWRRRGTATSTGKWRRPPLTPAHHKGGPDAADMDRLVSGLEALSSPSNPGVSQTPSTPTRCRAPGPPSSQLNEPASGSAGEIWDQMPAAVVSPVLVQDPTPVLGPDLWAAAPKVADLDLEPPQAIFPPTPALSFASAKASWTVPLSAEQSAFPSSPSSLSAPPGRRYSPAQSIVPSSSRAPSAVSAAPSTLVSWAPVPSSLPPSLTRRLPPPPPTTVLMEGATGPPSVVEGPAQDRTNDDASGGDTAGVEEGGEALEDRIRESLESTRLAWRYVVEVEAAAQAVLLGIDGTV